MIMSVYKLVGLRCHGILYICVISKFQRYRVPKGSIGLCIPRIVKVITIWDGVLFKLRVSFDGLVIRKKVFLECSHCIETNLYVVIEVLKVQISVNF